MRVLLAIAMMLTWPLLALPNATAQTSLQKSLEKQLGKDKDKPKEQVEKRTEIRFLLEDDYPPFNYLDEDRVLTGFNVDMARAICLEMAVTCQFVVKDWDGLIPSLLAGEGDAIISSMKITPFALKKVAFTKRYYFTPARFIVRRDARQLEMSPEGLESRRIAVVSGSAHEAYLKAFFVDSRLVVFATLAEARQSLIDSKVDALFGDGIGHSFWLTGTASKACCAFKGAAYFDPKYFGDGVAIAVRRGDFKLRSDLNSALDAVRRNGRYEELFLRSFPIKIY